MGQKSAEFRKINFRKINLDLTERECDLILFLQANKKANLKEIEKNILPLFI